MTPPTAVLETPADPAGIASDASPLMDHAIDPAAGRIAVDDLGPDAPSQPRRVNPVLAAAFAIGVAVYAVRSGNTLTLLVALAFAAMIFLHELGHFVTARLTGMKATEFFVGFGPRVWSFRRGETEYGIKAIPLGGYVKILGMTNLEHVDPADEHRAYRQQSYPRRVLVASAGTLVHLILALVLLTGVYSGFGEAVSVEGQLRIGKVVPELAGKPSPAAAAGINTGEWLLTINGVPLENLPRITSNGQTESVEGAVARTINTSAGKPLTIEVGNTATMTSRSITATPVAVDGVGRLGLGELSAKTITKRMPLHRGVARSVGEIRDLAPATFQALGEFLNPSQIKTYSKVVAHAGEPGAADKLGGNRFVSPVGAVREVQKAASIDFRRGIQFFAMINVFVGVFNMMPTLPFDGGHVVIATYERIRSIGRRRHYADVSRLMPVVYAVMFVLIAIGVSSLYLDVRAPI